MEIKLIHKLNKIKQNFSFISEVLNKELGLKEIPLSELRSRYESVHSRYAMIQGMNVHFTDQGHGQVIVLLHGILFSLHTWEAWAEYLKKDYRVISIDLPGFGLTGPHPQKKYHPDDYVEFLSEFIQHLDIHDFHLAGNSMGGLIAWLFTRKFPNKIGKLILLNPGAYHFKPSKILKHILDSKLLILAKLTAPRILFNLGLKDVYSNKQRITPEISRRYHELFLREGNREAMLELAKILTEINLKDELKKQIKYIKNPILLQWGTDDKWLPSTQINKWENDAKNITVIKYAGVGHIPMEETPKMTVIDAKSFIDQ